MNILDKFKEPTIKNQQLCMYAWHQISAIEMTDYTDPCVSNMDKKITGNNQILSVNKNCHFNQLKEKEITYKCIDSVCIKLSLDLWLRTKQNIQQTKQKKSVPLCSFQCYASNWNWY